MTGAATRNSTRRLWNGWGLTLAAVGVLAVVSYIVVPMATTTTVQADFVNTTGLYEGDDVRVMGVRVGSVESIEPAGDHSVVTLSVDKGQPVPADANALIVSPSLVSARFVQLAPAYTGGEKLAQGARIPMARTAVPVEWDEIKDQLSQLAKAVGPTPSSPQGPLEALVDVGAANLDGEGASLHETITNLSEAMDTIADGEGDLFAVIRNLQIFVTALSQSGQQIVTFNDRMATVTDILNGNSDDMASALDSLDFALGRVEQFVRDIRGRLNTSLDGLATVSATLAQQRDGIEQVLHVAPTALANLQGIYQPAHNSVVSALALSNFANPINFVCSAIAAAEQVDAQEGSRLCVEYLGPLLESVKMDYPPIATNPTRGVGALPDQLVYSPPSLANLMIPGGSR